MNKLLVILCILIAGCMPDGKQVSEMPSKVEETLNTPDSVFTELKRFPVIYDTTEFITALRNSFRLDIHENEEQRENEEITAFQK